MAQQPKRPVQVEEPASFADIMDTPMSQIKPLTPMPPGIYRLMVVGDAAWQNARTGTQMTVYTCQYLAPFRDVDMDALKQALTLPDGTVQAITERTIAARFFHTQAALPRLHRFLNNLGIPDRDEDDNEIPIREAIKQVAGRQFLGQIVHGTSDEGTVYNNLGTTAKVE